MFKKFVLTMAVLGFTASALAQARKEKPENRLLKDKEQIKVVETNQKNDKASDNNREKIEAVSKRLAELKISAKAESLVLLNESTREALMQVMVKNNEAKQSNSEKDFEYLMLYTLNRAQSDVKNREVLLRIVEEYIGLSALGKEGLAKAHIAMHEVVAQLKEGNTSMRNIAELAIGKAFPELSGKEKEEKVDEFLVKCLGKKA